MRDHRVSVVEDLSVWALLLAILPWGILLYLSEKPGSLPRPSVEGAPLVYSMDRSIPWTDALDQWEHALLWGSRREALRMTAIIVANLRSTGREDQEEAFTRLSLFYLGRTVTGNAEEGYGSDVDTQLRQAASSTNCTVARQARHFVRLGWEWPAFILLPVVCVALVSRAKRRIRDAERWPQSLIWTALFYGCFFLPPMTLCWIGLTQTAPSIVEELSALSSKTSWQPGQVRVGIWIIVTLWIGLLLALPGLGFFVPWWTWRRIRRIVNLKALGDIDHLGPNVGQKVDNLQSWFAVIQHRNRNLVGIQLLSSEQLGLPKILQYPRTVCSKGQRAVFIPLGMIMAKPQAHLEMIVLHELGHLEAGDALAYRLAGIVANWKILALWSGSIAVMSGVFRRFSFEVTGRARLYPTPNLSVLPVAISFGAIALAYVVLLRVCFFQMLKYRELSADWYATRAAGDRMKAEFSLILRQWRSSETHPGQAVRIANISRAMRGALKFLDWGLQPAIAGVLSGVMLVAVWLGITDRLGALLQIGITLSIGLIGLWIALIPGDAEVSKERDEKRYTRYLSSLWNLGVRSTIWAAMWTVPFFVYVFLAGSMDALDKSGVFSGMWSRSGWYNRLEGHGRMIMEFWVSSTIILSLLALPAAFGLRKWTLRKGDEARASPKPAWLSIGCLCLFTSAWMFMVLHAFMTVGMDTIADMLRNVPMDQW